MGEGEKLLVREVVIPLLDGNVDEAAEGALAGVYERIDEGTGIDDVSDGIADWREPDIWSS